MLNTLNSGLCVGLSSQTVRLLLVSVCSRDALLALLVMGLFCSLRLLRL